LCVIFPGGNYNAKALMSTAKRRGRIIRCCGFSKCDPSLTGNMTNNGRPKPPRNNKTASGSGNVK
jgi:hypothetical protein